MIKIEISAKGRNNGQSKLTEVDVMIIREARSLGFKVSGPDGIAQYFKMSPSYINGICTNRSWTHCL